MTKTIDIFSTVISLSCL